VSDLNSPEDEDAEGNVARRKEDDEDTEGNVARRKDDDDAEGHVTRRK
jgi:hypothetical protein